MLSHGQCAVDLQLPYLGSLVHPSIVLASLDCLAALLYLGCLASLICFALLHCLAAVSALGNLQLHVYKIKSNTFYRMISMYSKIILTAGTLREQ